MSTFSEMELAIDFDTSTSYSLLKDIKGNSKMKRVFSTFYSYEKLYNDYKKRKSIIKFYNKTMKNNKRKCSPFLYEKGNSYRLEFLLNRYMIETTLKLNKKNCLSDIPISEIPFMIFSSKKFIKYWNMFFNNISFEVKKDIYNKLKEKGFILPLNYKRIGVRNINDLLYDIFYLHEKFKVLDEKTYLDDD